MSTSTIDVRLIPTTQYATPTTGQTVTANSTGFVRLLINPAGTLATLTVTLPGSPSDGDIIDIWCTQIVTALTMNGGTIIGALASFAVGSHSTFIYSSSASEWIG